jgi:anti-sigma factor RsiW
MASECTKVEGLMQAALDDELDAKGRARFDAHIKACASCRRKYEALARAVAVFAAAPRLEPSPTFVADVVRRARLAKAGEARRRRAFTWVTAAAAAAAAAGAFAFWGRFFGPALGSAAASFVKGLAVTAADGWKVAKALAVPGEVFGKIVSVLGGAGSHLAWEGLKSASPVYFAAFVAVGLFYLVWRAGSKAAAPRVLSV